MSIEPENRLIKKKCIKCKEEKTACIHFTPKNRMCTDCKKKEWFKSERYKLGQHLKTNKRNLGWGFCGNINGW